jgi:site-specific recombinase XerD
MERSAKASGVQTSGHRLRPTLASHVLEQGAELVSVREFLGHASITFSARDAKVSHQNVKQVYVKAMRSVMQQARV